MSGKAKNNIILKCPTCGAIAGVKSGKTQCTHVEHPPMVPVWASTGIALTPEERQPHRV